MNTWQVARQIKYRVENQTWSGGSTVAFGSAVISARPREISQGVGLRFPLAIVLPGSSQSDRDEPDLIEQSWTIWLVVAVKHDNVGETALMGSNRPDGKTGSAGRGLLELEEVLYDAITSLSDDDGVRMKVLNQSAVDSAIDEDLGYVAFRGYRLTSQVTADRFYHPPTRLSATDDGGGDTTLTWTLPPDRFDRFRVVLRRASGGTAPSSVTGGTGVTLSGNLATSVTDSPGVGTFSYALFAQYDDWADTPATAVSTSAADTVTVTVS